MWVLMAVTRAAEAGPALSGMRLMGTACPAPPAPPLPLWTVKVVGKGEREGEIWLSLEQKTQCLCFHRCSIPRSS